MESAKDHDGQKSAPRSRRRSGLEEKGAEEAALNEDAGAAAVDEEARVSEQLLVERSSSPQEEAVPAEAQKRLLTETWRGDADSRD